MQLRFGQGNRVWYDPTPAYAYRLHDASITHTQADVARQFYEAQARRFLQQRVEQGQDDLQRGTPPPPPVNGKGNAGRSAPRARCSACSWDNRGAAPRRGRRENRS